MMKKTLVLAVALLIAMAGTAAAQTYPPAGGGPVTVSDTTPTPGQAVTIVASGFQPGTDVTFMLYSQPVNLGTATADAAGTATLQATIPANIAPGTHTIEATGTGTDGLPRTVTLQITVVAPGGAGVGDLPRTGSDSAIPMSQIAVGAIALGGLMVLVAGKRRNRTDARETAGV